MNDGTTQENGSDCFEPYRTFALGIAALSNGEPLIGGMMEVEQSFFKKENTIGVVLKTMVHGKLTGILIEKGWQQIEAVDYLSLKEAKHVWLQNDGEIMQL
jgi:hypothetical protein